MSQPTVAILGYHKIGPPPPGGWESWFYVSEQTFERQIQVLREGGWEPIDVRRFLAGLANPHALPERSALLTFDDGYRSMHAVALPILQRLEAPAVLFVPTEFVGKRNTFDRGVEPDEDICDWTDLRGLARGGVSIQSHAVTHRRFSELSQDERRRELMDSKTTLEFNLGESVELMAFPYGDPGPSDEDDWLSAAGYHAACLYGGGPVRLPVSNPYRLERIAMGPDTDLATALGALP
jgi:peptidoglycan/xylan/chitin deacetylase (PgdA/CDA1 family)